MPAPSSCTRCSQPVRGCGSSRPVAKPLGVAGETDYPVPPLSGAARPGSRCGLALPCPRTGGAAPPRHRRCSARSGRADLCRAGRAAARDRAGRGASESVVIPGDRGAARRPVPLPRLVAAADARAPPDAARGDGLELPIAHAGGAVAIAAARCLQRRLHARGGGRGLPRRRRGARARTGQPLGRRLARRSHAARRCHALPAAADGTPIRPRADRRAERKGRDGAAAGRVHARPRRAHAIGPAVGVAGMGGSVRAGARESARRAHLEPRRRRARVAAPAGERRLAVLVGERRPRRRHQVARDGARAGSTGASRRSAPKRSRGPRGSPGQRGTSSGRANTPMRHCRSSPPPGIVAASRRR